MKNDVFSADAIVLSYVQSGQRVLEVWCTNWYMSKYMKNHLNCVVTWIEFSANEAKVAAQWQEKTYVWDLDSVDFVNSIEWKYDIIMYAAVLEHIKFSEQVLQSFSKLLKDDGYIIISLPNVAHWTVSLKLLFGIFDYKDYGIMDDTHLKIYTYKTAKKMIKEGGFDVMKFTVSFPFPLVKYFWKLPVEARPSQRLHRTHIAFPWFYLFQASFVRPSCRRGLGVLLSCCPLFLRLRFRLFKFRISTWVSIWQRP